MNYPPERSEVHFVRCLKCYKILKCSRYDSSALLEHIRADHPEIEIVEGVPPSDDPRSSDASPKLSIRTEKVGGNVSNFSTDGYTSGESGRNLLSDSKMCAAMDSADAHEQDDDSSRRYTSGSMQEEPSPRRRTLYRTSIEKWRPAKGTLYCPKCGSNKRPLVRTRSERASSNSCGAACLLTCWPFCFLPCLFGDDDKEYLHCANCRNFLGLYDRQANCVKPNREFVEQSTPRNNNRTCETLEGKSQRSDRSRCEGAVNF